MVDDQTPPGDPSPFASHFSRVAVVHDWLTGMRGGEAVLEAILELFPHADLYTLFHFPGRVSPAIERHRIVTSPLQRIAMDISDYRRLLPLYPWAATRWDLSGYDLVVSSSHCVAKGVRVGRAPHLCYCHTPMRYMWDRFDDYFPRSKPVMRLVAGSIRPALQRWDVSSAKTVTRFIANSTFVAGRIAAFYGRDAAVIHPFADDAFFSPSLSAERGDEHVVVSALVPYKGIDLAIEAVRGTTRRLTIIGDGPSRSKLVKDAPPNVHFAGSVSKDRIVETLSRARSLILPGVEDFGITPLEAMALGTPVVALGAGGVVDSVRPGVTGIFFERREVEALRDALDAVERGEWNRPAIREHVRRFSRRRFTEELRQQVIALAHS